MSINKQQTEESELLERKLEAKVEDELYMLNYEDIMAGMPTRFKYRQGEPIAVACPRRRFSLHAILP